MEVLFGTPSYDKQVCVDYLQSMVTTSILLTAQKVHMHLNIHAGNCFIDRARNAIVHYFLNETEATDLIFVDADIGWDATAIGRVLSHEAEIVAGLVPKREADHTPKYHQNALTGVMQNGLFQAIEAPTAFMRIKRSAFAKLDAAYPELHDKSKYVDWDHPPYFQTGGNVFQGEDINFCRKWVAMGEFVWIDSDINFTHRGTSTWKGNFYDHAVSTGLLNRG